MTSHRPPGLRGRLAVLAAASLALAAAPARADGTVGVVVTGEATMQPQLVAQLETWLRAHGHDLISAPLPPDAINALIDCFVIEDQACARKIVEQRAKSSSVVFAQVNVTSGATALDRTVTLTAHWLDKGKDAITQRRSCERCTDVAMRSVADGLMAALTAASATRGRLKLTSTPPGATVTIDGKPVGETPLDHSVPPGDHEIVFEHGRRPIELRRVTIEKGQTRKVEVALGPAPSRALAFVALAGGAALGIAGGVLIRIDEDVPADPGDPEYLDTQPAGIALAATGAVALGVGVYLLVRKPSRRPAPAVSLISGGGVIGWTGRF